ncbi:pyruvate formate lyase family protein [Hellea sp.]|nr:pyruvate formate lyase family protein [Hellea sp.]
MINMFEAWRSKSPYPAFDGLGHLRDHKPDVLTAPLPVRRGHAFALTLQMVAGEWGQKQGLTYVAGDELIIGNMPPYSVGQGKEVLDYLLGAEDDGEDERLKFEMGFMNPWSNFGHICPNYETLVNRGLDSIIQECHSLKGFAEPDKADFYDSVVIALEGVKAFADIYADACEKRASKFTKALGLSQTSTETSLLKDRIANMTSAADRLRRIPAKPCSSFLDAVQAIFLLNSALHWTGELSSLGRLDQILAPFLERDNIPEHQAQEIIDCLWVKLDEQVVLDNRIVEDHFTSADGALLGAGGASNFDQGALINQWMQQITIGGCVADNEPSVKDASNAVTRMCLNAARRLPFNCPTLDLRVHKGTPKDILELAASSILSGGAHPILMNDDKLIPALHRAGDNVELRAARNYACDGCYETHFPGETEFSFIYVPGLDVLEKALNSGAGFGSSGGVNLRGSKGSFRTKPASEIQSFEEFYAILEEHIWLGINRTLSGLINAYGIKGGICPTPILSALIDGCIESGRDLYNGGAKYKMFAPLMTGISTVADSLYVIKNYVFDEGEMSLEALVAILRSDWGSRTDIIGQKPDPEEIAAFRQKCINAPKFGFGDAQVDQFAWRLAESFTVAVKKALAHPLHATGLKALRDKYETKIFPFNMLITPGVGTFEQYVFGGSYAGATADGRKAFQPIASDLAAAPYPQDISLPDTPPEEWAEHAETQIFATKERTTSLSDSMASWNHSSFEAFSDGAPADYNIPEDFPHDKLVKVLRRFADGEGGNMMTVTVANRDTFKAAMADPQFYDLLRVRMGGWSEFFSVLYGNHKKQHIRRPQYHV